MTSKSLPLAASVAARQERQRVLAIIDICPTSKIGASLRAAIERGDDREAFAKTLARVDRRRRQTSG